MSELQVAQHVLEVLEQGTQILQALASVGSSLQDLGTISGVLSVAASSFALIGAILSLVSLFVPIPDYKHEQILKEFRRVHEGIHMTRDGIDQLGKEMKNEMTKLQYIDDVDILLTAIDYSTKIAGSKNNTIKENMYKRKLTELCDHERCQQALNVVFRGLVGNHLFHNKILNAFYDKSGGDRPKIVALNIRLLRLVSSGLISVMVYETIQHNYTGAQMQAPGYQEKLNDTIKEMDKIVQKCIDEHKKNMKTDLLRVLDKNADHKTLARYIKNSFANKYDWLNIVALVYNNIEGNDNHVFDGDYISMNFNNKNSLVFYRPKKFWFRNGNRMDEVRKIASESQIYYWWSWWNKQTGRHDAAETVFNELEERMTNSAWWGVAVIKRYEDLWMSFSVSGRQIVWDVGEKFVVCVLVK